MPDDKPELLKIWLKQLFQMIPGISQAVLITSNENLESSFIHWPNSVAVEDEIKSAAKLSASQHKTVTTTLSSEPGNDSASDIIIALPVNSITDLTVTLAFRVRIKPSQQVVVMQIVDWGEDWLKILLQQRKDSNKKITVEDEATSITGRLTGFFTGRSWLPVFLLMVIVLLMSVIPGNYRVTAPASVEGKIQRVIVASFDGYISKAFARAGETVKKGQVIAELDSRELSLQLQQVESEKNEHTRQYRQALAKRDQAQAHIFKSQISQSEARIKLLKKKINRTSLLSPLDGVIISGDLSRSLGARVSTGDILFEVAPLDEYRLVIMVNEKQVVDVQKGLSGVLTLNALPLDELNFVVDKVSPVFEENVTGIVYRVEASLTNNHPSLRPGMQGTAKIDISQRSYGWIYLHELYHAIRLWVWSWLP